MDIGALLGQMG
jgi:26S proteasome regulatory subunit N11